MENLSLQIKFNNTKALARDHVVVSRGRRLDSWRAHDFFKRLH
ncbi:hypothetical protein HMPREF1248_0771 [Coriobacteriaceae bacterium BV3Ac1]|nr:hypothetical protein HMPREF1248_0771 [Coriobacteriaceae bacterium BV3Ac1]